MAQAVAYGSITIVDITDVSEFSVQPMSNLPLSVIYDPDQNNYSPDWSTSNLRLTPLVYYGGDNVALGTTGLTITWERQEGVSGRTALTTGETIVDNGVLQVSQTKFTSSIAMLTYIVTATYNEPTSQQTLTAQGQITFSLVRNASTTKSATITGESIFKYNTSQAIVGATSITLTGKVNNVSISEWQYQSATNPVTWTKYPGSGTGTTLTVNATDSTFINDKCIIRLMTSDNTVYDLHTITKLRDGAAGSATVSAVLTNDDQSIPIINGTPDYSAATTRIIIYNGGSNDTANWTITLSGSTGVTFSGSRTTANNDTVSVTGMTTDSGTVTFTCRKTGEADIIKTFSVIKIPAGQDGVSPTIYSIDADNYALNRAENDTLTPSSVTFRAYSQTGNNPKGNYEGRFKIFENITYAEYIAASPKPTAVYTSTGNESSHAYSPSTSATSILCILFEAGGTTTIKDNQSVVITSDGATGEQGEQGEDGKPAVNVIFSNYSDTLTCTNDNKLSASQTIKIPFAAYEGTTRIPCTFTSVNLLGVAPAAIGTGTNNSKYATTTSDGQIVWVLPSGTSVSSPSDILSITFTAQTSDGNVPVVCNYSWSRNTAAKDGVNSVMLQIFTPSGTNTLTPSVTSTMLQAQLTDGATDKTSSATYQWAKFQSGTYTNISGATSYQYTVQGSTVDSYASFRCTASYNSKPYVAYFSVFDKTDPIQVAVISSVGNQLVNGIGSGALYVKVTRNGQEVDAIKSERFLTANPSSASSGDYYYKLDSTNKSVTLMKYNGSAWSSQSNPYTGTYSWSWRDKNGDVVTDVGGNTLPTEGKVIYIDGSMVDSKIVADVEVTI